MTAAFALDFSGDPVPQERREEVKVSTIVIRTYAEGFAALDMMHKACEYLASQYSDFMTRDEAMAHFEAREILWRREMALLDEMELAYFYEDQL